MKALKDRIERRTGLLFGLARGWDEKGWGPEPILHVVIRPGGRGWVNLEVRAFGRTLYVSETPR